MGCFPSDLRATEKLISDILALRNEVSYVAFKKAFYKAQGNKKGLSSDFTVNTFLPDVFIDDSLPENYSFLFKKIFAKVVETLDKKIISFQDLAVFIFPFLKHNGSDYVDEFYNLIKIYYDVEELEVIHIKGLFSDYFGLCVLGINEAIHASQMEFEINELSGIQALFQKYDDENKLNEFNEAFGEAFPLETEEEENNIVTLTMFNNALMRGGRLHFNDIVKVRKMFFTHFNF